MVWRRMLLFLIAAPLRSLSRACKREKKSQLQSSNLVALGNVPRHVKLRPLGGC